MKIQYDHQIFSFQKYGGVSRYFYELIKEFDKTDDIHTSTSLLVSNNHYIFDSKLTRHWQFFPNFEFRGKQKLMTPLNKMVSIQKLKKQDFDLFHPTYYDPYFLEYLNNKPFVLTVHDMIHEKFSEYFDANDNTSINKKLLSEKASKIITVSKHTKNDLVEIFGTDPSKIEVIYHGNSMLPNDTATLKMNIPGKYILFVGSRVGYKNFDSFIYAATRLLNNNPDLSIVCAGGGKFNSNEQSLFDKLNIGNKIFQYNLDDDSLAFLYKKADLFVFPSIYEGFGIPLLEAFSCDCPVVCSNSSSLPEIADNAAAYFNPADIDSIFSTMAKVLGNNNLKEELIQNGRKRLKIFSWEKTAHETKKVYESIL
jgi:glycosyltransferase involved in cell wall biosynthesis